MTVNWECDCGLVTVTWDSDCGLVTVTWGSDSGLVTACGAFPLLLCRKPVVLSYSLPELSNARPRFLSLPVL